MALDHSRDYFTSLNFDPELISRTDGALFLTRWVTHFSAPAFFLLAGMGAYLYGARHGRRRLTTFLWTRGLWLVFVEFSIVGFAWTFLLRGGFFGVIWCLGASMLALSVAVRFHPRMVAVASLAIIVLHDLVDGVRPAQLGAAAPIWSIIHAGGVLQIADFHSFVLFPLVPWVAVMGAGYWLGSLSELNARDRSTYMRILGYGCVIGFVALRFSNLYGNPPAGLGGVSQGDWHLQSTMAKSIILFFDVEKYPPSLQFLLMTLGPLLLLLDRIGRYRPSPLNPLLVFGRVPLFFYICHIYLIHTLAVGIAWWEQQPWSWLLHGAFFRFDIPGGYGHGLPFVYAVWLLVLALMYYPCLRFSRIKQTRQNWWLSYL